MTKKKTTSILREAISRAKSKKRLTIIEMPEEYDTAPHWLLWFTLIAFGGLMIAIVWQLLATQPHLQALLPLI